MNCHVLTTAAEGLSQRNETTNQKLLYNSVARINPTQFCDKIPVYLVIFEKEVSGHSHFNGKFIKTAHLRACILKMRLNGISSIQMGKILTSVMPHKRIGDVFACRNNNSNLEAKIAGLKVRLV